MSYVVQFVLSYAFWVLLVWPFDPSSPERLLVRGGGADLLAGVAVAGLVAAVFGRSFPRHPSKLKDPLRWLRFVWFLWTFACAWFSAAMDIAYRVLHLRLPVRPAVVRVRTSVRSDMGKFMLVSSLNLTPGTLVVDVVGQDLYVHWMNTVTDSPELRAELIVGRFEEVLGKVFD
jgi:multicomponent Na+:H+ antiporter subunit E